MILGDSVKLTSSGKREFNFIIAKVSKRIENRRHVKMLYKKHKNNTILKALSNDPNDIPFPVFVVQSLRFQIGRAHVRTPVTSQSRMPSSA